MNLSIFEVMGPVMVGPSSSHTAGAVRIGNVAAMALGEPITQISFGLYGSFLQTGLGHGTYCALLAGAMGLKPDDERIARAFLLAQERGIRYSFHAQHLKNAHENSVLVTAKGKSGILKKIIASSIGGGRISIDSIDGFLIGVSAELPTVIVGHLDSPGVICEITGVFVRNGVNIAAMKVSRAARGMRACCIIETDSTITQKMFEPLIDGVRIFSACVLQPVTGECANV